MQMRYAASGTEFEPRRARHFTSLFTQRQNIFYFPGRHNAFHIFVSSVRNVLSSSSSSSFSVPSSPCVSPPPYVMSKRRLDFDTPSTVKYQRVEMSPDQSNGLRRSRAKSVVSGRKKYTQKGVLSAAINHTTQALGLVRGLGYPGSGIYKHLVGEFNPNTGGFVSIGKKIYNGTTITDANYAQLPCHVYDLNFFSGSRNDNATNFPVNTTTQCQNTNSRMWKLGPGSTFITGGTAQRQCEAVRYSIINPRTLVQDQNPSQFVYRKFIDIKYQVFGCVKMPTEFDIRVIRVLDPKMCPDYPISLTNTGSTAANPGSNDLDEFKQNWQNLMLSFTVNPLLRGEPGPEPVKRWFKTVAKKRVTLGEQTADVETVPCVSGSIRVNLNRKYDYSWSMRGFDYQDLGGQQNDIPQGVYDSALNLDDQKENDAFIHKPDYKDRYYLVIRALCPVDTGAGTNQDTSVGGNEQDFSTFNDQGLGGDSRNYTPSYDLIVKTGFATVNGHGG